ncbi:MAG: helix-turn-helix transcriptional regulator [Proteobacteria bacterium]|nr:helix-turn-helix transcriptional regulator [Pseudomonadota bacterium]
MKANTQKKLLDELYEVLERHSLKNYNPELVIEILSRSLNRKPETRKEYIKNIVKPYELLKEQRKRMLYTLEKVSTLTGIPKSNLSAMENGKRPIGLKMAKVLSSALEISYKTLL